MVEYTRLSFTYASHCFLVHGVERFSRPEALLHRCYMLLRVVDRVLAQSLSLLLCQIAWGHVYQS